MKQDLSKHPAYSDEEKVRAGTQWHLDRGHSVFQLFQVGSEREHSETMLRLLQLPYCASVLSLGCGVGGMERYWQLARPDLSFELVNITPTQLAMSVCRGTRVQADAQGYVSANGPFDCVVMAYMLGHVDVSATLASAIKNLRHRGTLLIYDVFDATETFNRELFYDSPSREEIERFAAERGLHLRHLMVGGFPPTEYVAQELPWLVGQATPCLFILGS